MNNVIGAKLSGEATTFLSANKVESDESGEQGVQYLVEILNTLTAGSAFLGHVLTLKILLSVMLLHNVDPLRVHVNGARHIVKSVTLTFSY